VPQLYISIRRPIIYAAWGSRDESSTASDSVALIGHFSSNLAFSRIRRRHQSLSIGCGGVQWSALGDRVTFSRTWLGHVIKSARGHRYPPGGDTRFAEWLIEVYSSQKTFYCFFLMTTRRVALLGSTSVYALLWFVSTTRGASSDIHYIERTNHIHRMLCFLYYILWILLQMFELFSCICIDLPRSFRCIDQTSSPDHYTDRFA